MRSLYGAVSILPGHLFYSTSMKLPATHLFAISQVASAARQGAWALLLTAALASCGGPSTPETAGAGTTIASPVPAAPSDSAQAALTTAAPDATITTPTADTATAKKPVDKPLDKPKSALSRATTRSVAAAPVPEAADATAEAVPAPAPEPAAPAAPTTRTQAGRVLDEAGQPLVGATILLKGSSKGTSTDANGNYSLEVPGGDDTFLIGYGGYTDETATAHDGQPLNVTLVPNPSSKVKSHRGRR